jgi:uncharacterized cupredoxin-like copper-binding protein
MHYATSLFTSAMFAISTFSFAPNVVRAHSGAVHKKNETFDPSSVENTAYGRAGDPAKARRTVQIGMDDQMHFMPGDLKVRKGQTVRFVVSNDGVLMHEMVIGTMKDLKKHAELMKKFPGMDHDEPHMVHVAPGKRGDLTWQFTKTGEFYYACLIPGHLEAGMIAKITVK